MTGTFRERRRRVGVAGLAIGLIATVIPLLSATPASADTATTTTVLASTDATAPSITRPGPLTSLVNGQVVTIKVTEASAADPIISIAAIRQCEGNAPITNPGDLGPTNTGYCLSSPFNGSSDSVKTNITKAAPTDNFIQTTFRVGTGTEPVTFDNGGGNQINTITCDATHGCSLWLQIGRGTSNDMVHYDLSFLLSQPGAPTAVAAICTANGANVSWTAPANNGGAVISNYTVTATPTGGGAAVTPVSSATTARPSPASRRSPRTT